ncbi:TetR family transcriptional regulator [Amycolatopsis sp. AA4]|uniref:TetR/AcrR family transcriptional regulator n=2 Tax=Actinomycetes TaxID=1760 RepID=UPI000C21F541|nr:TetR/AcrR family transcriptional regulator [Amycolatopsis sp. AA4]ATY11361.1 TetR family transcriptional regulator [Amycolatopsis sp. AA4]
MSEGYLKGRIRRDDIVSAAAVVYGEAGYHASSLREIAKRAGITHAGLLYHFPTKEALLAAVLERRDAEDAAREQLTAAPPGLEVLRRFIALAEHNVRHRGIVEVYSRLAAEAISEDHPAHAYFARHYREARETIAQSFHALAETGELRPGVDPDLAALTFIALMDGLQVQWLTTPTQVDPVGSLRLSLQTLLTVPLFPK